MRKYFSNPASFINAPLVLDWDNASWCAYFFAEVSALAYHDGTKAKKELKNMRKEVLLNVLNGLYKSPEHEVSVWKNVPITYLPLLKEHFRGELRYRPRNESGTFAAYRI